MEYSEVIESLESMRSRFDDGFSAIDRGFLEKINFLLFGKGITNKGCGDCYRDAYLLIYNHLKKTKTMPQPSLYTLKPGVVIQFFGSSTVYTNANLTDEVAEKFLAKNSGNKRFFTNLPSNWEERVATRIAAESSEQESKADPDVLSKLTDKLSLSEQELEKANALLKDAQLVNEELRKENIKLKEIKAVPDETEQLISNLTLENETLQGENASLKEENVALKNENRALKSANTRLKNNASADPEPETETDSE